MSPPRNDRQRTCSGAAGDVGAGARGAGSACPSPCYPLRDPRLFPHIVTSIVRIPLRVSTPRPVVTMWVNGRGCIVFVPRDPCPFLHIVTPSAGFPLGLRLPEWGATMCGNPEGVTKTENHTPSGGGRPLVVR